MFKDQKTEIQYGYIINPVEMVNNVVSRVNERGQLIPVSGVTIQNFLSPFAQPSTSVKNIPSLIIEQNFADGSAYKDGDAWKKRTMMPQYKGKSSMELVLDGSRTRSTRSKTEIARYMKDTNVSKVSDLIGLEVLMFDKTGSVPGKAVVKITNIANFTQEYQDATWQKEGWTKDVTDRLVGEFPYAIEWVLVRNETFTIDDIKNAQRKDC
jgi:hypothetical protein